MRVSWNFLTSLLLCLSTPSIAWDYVLERIDHSHSSKHSGRITFDVQVGKVNYSDYAITGNITYLSPFTRSPDTYHHSMNFYISNSEHHHYDGMPIRYPRVTYCEFINTSYRKHIMKSVKSPVTNGPYAENQNDDLCQGFRAEHDLVFYIHRYVVDKSTMRPTLPDGLIRIETLFELDDSVIAGIVLVVKIENHPDLRNEIAMF